MLYGIVEVASSYNVERRDGERMVRVTAAVNSELMSNINTDMKDNFMPGLEQRYPGLVIPALYCVGDDISTSLARLKSKVRQKLPANPLSSDA